MRKRVGKILALSLAVVILLGTMGIGAGAAGKTKTFKLLTGDSITLSNYVEERTEEIYIEGEANTITYYLVDEQTRILFNVKSDNAVEGEIIQGIPISEKNYELYAGHYLGDVWGWPEDYSALSAFKCSIWDGDVETVMDCPFAGIWVTDFDSDMIPTEDGYSYEFSDRIKFYMMKSEQPRPVAPETAQAKPTASNVLVNGKQTAFDAYNIAGNNYFKLRDLAYALNGSEKQFEVTWDGANNAILLLSDEAYTSVGGEMEGKGAGNQTAKLTSSKILLDGDAIALTAYHIGGNNYFKLRDIGQAFDFGVTWDGALNTISIDSSIGYTE